MQSAGEIYSDSAWLQTHTHTFYTQIHGYIPASANYRPALTALNYPPYPHFTIRVNPSALIFFPFTPFLFSFLLLLSLRIPVFRVWNIKQAHLKTPSGTEVGAVSQASKKIKIKKVRDEESGGKAGAPSHQHY